MRCLPQQRLAAVSVSILDSCLVASLMRHPTWVSPTFSAHLEMIVPAQSWGAPPVSGNYGRYRGMLWESATSGKKKTNLWTIFWNELPLWCTASRLLNSRRIPIGLRYEWAFNCHTSTKPNLKDVWAQMFRDEYMNLLQQSITGIYHICSVSGNHVFTSLCSDSTGNNIRLPM